MLARMITHGNIIAAQKLKVDLDYMYSLKPSVIKLGLERTKNLLNAVGNPHNSIPCVHITGTNGKGSTAAMLESILRASGLKTGLYTSPHLHLFNERIRISGQNIKNEELAPLIAELRTASNQFNIRPTFHEFTTVLALLHFARMKVELAVIEVCMGGLLDTTNVISPLVSIITNIGIDHTNYLGHTKQEIAREKAGIIKPGTPVITAETTPDILDYFRVVAAKNQAPLYEVSNLFSIVRGLGTWSEQTFAVKGSISGSFHLGLLGKHQLDNAKIVLQTIKLLRERGFYISDQALKTGLANVKWPGRLDVVSEKPFVLVDAAHNRDSVQALRDFILAEIPSNFFDVFIFGMKRDKDIKPIQDLLLPLCKKIIITQGSFQPAPADQLARQIRKYHDDVLVMPDPKEAITRGRSLIDKDGSMLVAGSLYMIPAALEYFQPSNL